MNAFDELLQGEKINIDEGYNTGDFDLDEWKKQKKEIRDKVYELRDSATKKVAEDAKFFQRYLNVQSKFMFYSVGNALLIAAQKPTASHIKDFDSWKKDGVFIKTGQTAFLIITAGDEYIRDDGSIGKYYEPKKVFDISQTSAEPIPLKPLPDEKTRLKALINKCPAEIDLVDNFGGEKAYFDPVGNTITVQKGLEPQELFRALSKEISHAYMANLDTGYDKELNELYAEGSSYILCQQNGIPVRDFDFSDAPDMLRGGEESDIREELSFIRDNVTSISEKMNMVFEHEKQKQDRGSER